MKRFTHAILCLAAVAAYAADPAPVSIQQMFQQSPKETAPSGQTSIITVRGSTVRRFSLMSTAKLIPYATATTPGVFKVGSGLSITDGVLNNTGVAGVASFKGRGGAVIPSADDYSIGQISGAATVAATGSYNDLSNKPTIPAAQVPSDWSASTGVARILNKPTIPSALSQLSEDSTHRTVTDAEKETWNSNSSPVQSFNGRIGAIVPQSGDYTAVMVGADALGSATSVQGNLTTHAADSTVHLNSTQKTDLTDSGDSALHYHATDRARANHTGEQAIGTVTGLQTALDSKAGTGHNHSGVYEPADATVLKESELSSSTSSSSTTTPANSAAVKSAYDLANGKLSPNGNGSALTGITPAQVGAATSAQGDLADTALQPGGVDNEVYATDYNGGVLSHVAINQAITAIGSAIKTLVLTPGTWPMSNHVTVPANITLRVMPGALIDHAAGMLSINGPLVAPRQMWLDNFEYPNLAFGKLVGEVYVDWVDAAGDGTAADQVPLRAILEASAHKDFHFNGAKTYNLTATLTAGYPTGIKIHGHGATLKSAVSDGTALNIGGWAASYTGQSIAVTKGNNTFTVPGGVSVAVGDMIRLTAGTEYVPGYKYGVLTNVVKIDGATATIDILPVYDFTAADVVVFTRTDDVEVEGIIFDNTGSTKDTNGLIVQGRNAYIHDNIAKGSEAAGIGLQFLGIGGKLEYNRTYDYLSKYSGAGGRYGDGIGVSGHNIEVVRNKLYNHKHALTISVREFATNTVTVRGNTFVQDPSRFGETFVQGGNTKYLYSGVVDIHGDAENVVFENNEIDGAGFALATIRNGRAVFKNNRMRLWNNTATGIGIFQIGETTLRSLVLSGNEIAAETASTPLMSEADGSWLHQIAVADPVYTNGIDVDVKQDGTNVLTNITTTTAFPTLAGNTPSTPCQNDQIWIDSNATSGQRVYVCEAGSWVLQGDGNTVYTLPTASAGTLGGVKVGDRLSITDGVLSADVQAGTVLTVREEDGTPTGTPSTLKFANGSVTDNGDGSFSVANTGGTTDHAALSNLDLASSGHTGIEPTLSAGTSAQYYRGDKTWQTLNQAAVAGLTTSSAPSFANGMTLTGSDASGAYLTLRNTSSTSARFPNLAFEHHGGSVGGYPFFKTKNVRGTYGSATATQANDQVGTWNAYGNGSTANTERLAGRFMFIADAAYTDANQRTSMVIELGRDGSSGTLTEVFKIEPNGAVVFPSGSSTAQSTNKFKVWTPDGAYLYFKDEDNNDARLGQKTLSLGAASGGTATLESTSHGTKGLLTIPNAVEVTSVLSAPTASPGTNTTQVATTAFVSTAVSNATSIGAGRDLPNQTTSFNIVTGDAGTLLHVEANSAITGALPDPTTVIGKTFWVRNRGISNLTISASNGGALYAGASAGDYVIVPGASATLYCDGANFFGIAKW